MNYKKMDGALKGSIIHVLESQYGMRRSGENFAGAICPNCGKKELWAVGDEPWSVQCNRIENCGYKGLIRELHPELFKTVTERAERLMSETKEVDPRGIAKYYLSNERGINPTRAGKFTQETAYNKKNGKGTATVRFTIDLENGQTTYWERLIEEIGSDKASFKYGASYSGFGWIPPEFDRNANRVWIVEGIFDALALQECGISAISAMTCHNFPNKTLQSLNINPLTTIVIALDSNKAGYEAIPKMVERAEDMGFINVEVALTKSKKDWNDCHLNNELTAEDIETYLYNGSIYTATSAYNKALLMWQHHAWQSFIVEYDYKTYWAEVKNASGQKDDDEDKEPELAINEIGSCLVDFLYVERSIATNETLFFLNIKNKRKSEKGVFSGKHFKSASEFGTRIIDTLPGANFTGKSHQVEKLYELKAPWIKTVNTIEYVGYCPEAKGYVFPQFAVKDGVVYKPNEEEYYSLNGYHVKSKFTPGSFRPSLTYNKVEWIEDYIEAFGTQNLIVLAYYFGSLFATQIREKLGFFPFLEFTGEAGAGKSAVLEFLWKIMGRDNYEGINPTTSTNVGRYRTLSQFSNMPTSYMEGQSESKDAKKGKDDWLYEIKSLYNGRAVRAKGNRNNGNDTDEVPFYGSIVISQNVKIQADDAVMTRLIYLHMNGDHHSPAGLRAATRLFNLELEDVSGFLINSILHEREILDLIFSKFEGYQEGIAKNEKIKHPRIIEAHALLMAILDALAETYNIKNTDKKEAAAHLIRIAEDRQKDLNLDPEPVLEFWYLLEDLARSGKKINHSKNDHFELAINLNQIASIARDCGMPPVDVALLRKLLPNNKRYEFLENKTVSSCIFNTTTRCYVFKWPGDWK